MEEQRHVKYDMKDSREHKEIDRVFRQKIIKAKQQYKWETKQNEFFEEKHKYFYLHKKLRGNKKILWFMSANDEQWKYYNQKRQKIENWKDYISLLLDQYKL